MLLTTTDPLGRTSLFGFVYDYANHPLRSESLDSGLTTTVYTALGQPLEATDAKGARVLTVADELGRPTAAYAKDTDTQAFTLRSRTIYGDDPNTGLANPVATNHLGRPYQSYDEAGKSTVLEYDFKGNALEMEQRVLKDELFDIYSGGVYTTEAYVIDWAPSLEDPLDSKLYITQNYYDGLDRTIKTILPEDATNTRREITPTYNRAGGVKSIDFDNQTYLSHVHYDASGRMLLQAFGDLNNTGSGMMTRMTYDLKTFRKVKE